VAALLLEGLELRVQSEPTLRPFVATPSRTGPKWLTWQIGDDSLRRRVRRAGTPGATALTAAILDGVRLELLTRADQSTLRGLDRLSAAGDEEVARVFERRFVAAANSADHPWATEDFLILGNDPDLAASVVGDAAWARFQAATQPNDRPEIEISVLDAPDSIVQAARRVGLDSDARRIADLTEWALGLVPATAGAPVRTRVGGLAPLPSTADWPVWAGRPLTFLALIDLAEASAALSGRTTVLQPPPVGALLFFADLVGWQGEPGSGPDGPAGSSWATYGARIASRPRACCGASSSNARWRSRHWRPCRSSSGRG
jgi:uncharacterized protein DUF1963